LIGTDFNPGIKGIGPKTALELVKKHKSLKNILNDIDWDAQFDGEPISAQEILDFFKKPPVTEEFEIKWNQPQTDAILKFMIDEFEFSQERIEKVLKTLEQKPQQNSLEKWSKKFI